MKIDVSTKAQKPLLSVLCILLIFLTACSQELLTKEKETFKELCVAHGHQWMKMSEMKEGMMTGKPCYGCMVGNTHFCSQKEYEAASK